MLLTHDVDEYVLHQNLEWEQSSTFESSLWGLIAITAALWLYAYLHFSPKSKQTSKALSINVIAAQQTQAPSAASHQEPAANATAISPPLEQDEKPAPITPQNKVIIGLPASNIATSAEEIRAALSTLSNAQSDDTSNHTNSPGYFPSELSKLRESTAGNTGHKKTASGLPFASSMEYIDSHGNLSYRSSNGCVFQKKVLPGGQDVWFASGCSSQDTITLEYEHKGRKFASFGLTDEKP